MGNADRPPSRGRAGADEGAGRAGHGGRGLGDVDRPDLRARPLRRDGRADRAGEGRRAGTAGSTPATSATRATGCSSRSTRRSPIGKGAGLPVHISHLKASGKANWGTVAPALRADRRGAEGGAGRHGRPVSVRRLEHEAGARWSSRTGRSRGRRRLRPARRRPGARAAAPRARSRRELDRRDGGAVDPDRPLRATPGSRRPRPGRRSPASEGTTPLEVVLDIQRHGGAQAISFGMSEDDVRDGHAARLRRDRLRRRRPTCPAAATSPIRAPTAPSRARSATPSTRRSSRSSRRSARARACRPRSSACPTAA